MPFNTESRSYLFPNGTKYDILLITLLSVAAIVFIVLLLQMIKSGTKTQMAGDSSTHFYKSKASTENDIIQRVHCLIPGSPENGFHALAGIHSGAIRVGYEGRLEGFQKSRIDPSVKSTTLMTQGA